MKSKFAIVAIGYNRLNSLKRLCNSLIKTNYLGDKVDLIISLDCCEDKSIYNFAKKFRWDYGNKEVILHEKRMGLRNHVLSCGLLLEDYDALAVLEDDIFVAPGFYAYMKQAVSYYEEDDNIAGISLYSYERNLYDGLRFRPVKSDHDTFFVQMAQSWGQVWMKRQWKEFYIWYQQNCDKDIFADLHIPSVIKNWGDASWLKYHIAYCVLNNKFFVCPYDSMTTCFMEVGEHTKYKDITEQTALCMGEKKQYNFAKYSENAVIYDVFYERMNLEKFMPFLNGDVRLCVDLYADKYQFEGYTHLLTSKRYPDLTPLQSYAYQLKPQELNIIFSIQGEDIYLYDIQNTNVSELTVQDNKWKRWEYFSSPKVASDFHMMLMYCKKLWNKHIRRL